MAPSGTNRQQVAPSGRKSSWTATATNGTDWKAVRDTISLVSVATNLLGPAPGRRGERGRALWWHCPFHEDRNPSFHVDPLKARWKCYGCAGRGDAADLVMRLEGKTFREAVAILTTGQPLAGTALAARQRPWERSKAKPSGMSETDAVALVADAERRLWTREGTEGLACLHGRRLADATIRAARLGWTPRVAIPRADGTTFNALGVVIPWFQGDRLALAKVRQPDGRKPKYAEAFRDPAALTLYPSPQAIRPGRPLVIVEGEFDALCLGEALGELAAAATLGSAGERYSPSIINAMLAAPRWYAAHDADPAGDGAASRWPTRARRVRPPGPFKDWTEAKLGGVDLRRWWTDRLGGNESPPLFSWGELSALRWGPAKGDPTPGIIIDRPDRDRMVAAMRAADDDPAERAAIQSGSATG